MSRSKDDAARVTHNDHEVIVPKNKLRGAVSNASGTGEDPVARAEKALAELSSEFASWMESECRRLDGACRDIATSGITPANKDALFRAAHDIKGEASTFGYPLVASAAESLCHLIEHAPDDSHVPSSLIQQHVDAIRAIHREHTRPDAKDLARTLTKRLREVTDDFLTAENRDRPDVLQRLRGPSIVPE